MIKKRNILRRYKSFYIFLIPAFLLTLVFSYLPMIGVIMAFQEYDPLKGFFGSEFVGWTNFVDFLNNPNFLMALKNTLIINILMLVVGFPMPIIFALLLNELQDGLFKRVTQSISYLPHFISWIVIAGLAYRLLEQDYGAVNLLIDFFGGEKIAFFREPKYFRGILIFLAIWKELGWNAIIYLAALSGIDPQLYEAATVDGANRFQKMVNITLPGIAPTVSLMFILQVGTLATSVGGASFQAILNLQNAMVAKVSTTLDYFIYAQGLKMNKMSMASAVGLAQSVVALLLVVITNWISKKKRGYGIF